MQEVFDLSIEVITFRQQRYSEAVNLPSCGARIRRATIDVRNAPGHLGRSLRGLLNAAGNLVRRRALLFDGRGDRAGNLGDLGDGAADVPDRGHRLRGSGLHLRHLRGDLFRGLRGLRRQRLDLGRHHGESPPGRARSRSLDGGVERQEIGLLGDLRDHLDDFADAVCRLRQLGYCDIGSLGLLDGGLGDLLGLLDLPADFGDGRSHWLRRRGRRLHI